MRKRNCRMEVYFTQAELTSVEKKAQKAGLSREGFARAAMLGKEINEAPSADTREILWQLRRSGSNLNQALQKMHMLGLADIPLLAEAAGRLFDAAEALIEIYKKPDA